MDFLHHALALRGLLKEPPYLWQPPSPDGGNLEQWAGGKEGWRMKGKGRVEVERGREREQEKAKPQLC